MGTIPCHRDLARLAECVGHPGLFFDRYMAYEDDQFRTYSQEKQRPHLENTIKKMKNAADNAVPTVLEQWLPPSLPLWVRWRQTTIWRLTIHLSRAAATENASVCLHPVYGFPYIPGTGLKGMTRAYAHIVLDKKEDDPEVQRIFGNLSRGAGTVIFHDAWPDKWPTLELDIVNSHHPEYYKNKGAGSPPGDWENPVPVFFLTIAPTTTFRFAVTPLLPSPEHIQDMHTAAKWLQQALQDLGTGGKTAAGYGYFSETIDQRERMAAPKKSGEDLAEAIEAMNRLKQECYDAGGYTHTRHFECMKACAMALRDARGAVLQQDDVKLIQSIAAGKAGEKKIKKLIEKLTHN